MRPNSVSVLPSHNSNTTAPQFKDKPLSGGIRSPSSPGSVMGRITLRKVILYSGGLLFIYIIISTILGSEHIRAGGSRSGFPVVKHEERDPYEGIQIPAPPVGGGGAVAGDQQHDMQEHHNQQQRPPAPAPVQQVPNQPLRKQAPAIQLDSVGGVEPTPDSVANNEGGDTNDDNSNRYTNDPTMIDDEGNASPELSDSIEEWPELRMVTLARKASPVTYAQMLSSTRRERDYAVALIVKEAELALRSTEVYSVTNKDQTAPSNDIHDYLSLSKYYWPNKNKPKGLPYKRIDGQVNPEIETVRDYRLLRTMIREVHVMGMAYHFTGRKAFADKAAMRLKEWFLDEATYMNPNINYGSLRKGERLGARTGVLDMFTIFRVFDALHYLKQEPGWPKDLIPNLQEWFRRYVYWLETSTLAQVERSGNNNHGTYFDVQIIAIYLFLGRTADARAVALSSLHTRIDPQIHPDGRQPEELERKTSWYYSVFNLQALMTLARWGDDLGVDMWNYEGPQGQSIKKAVDFMLPYAMSNGEGWPVDNYKGFDMTDYLKCLNIAWYIYGDEKYLDAIEVLLPKVERDMEGGKIKTVSTFMCDISTLLEATTRGGQGFIWHWCLT